MPAYPNPDPAEQAVRERGGLQPSPPAPGELPPGGGLFDQAHWKLFSGVQNLASRTYRYAFDEALRDSRINALAMRRDPVVMSALRDRQLPVCQLDSQIEPLNDADQDQVKAAHAIHDALMDTPRFQQLKRCMCEALFYGRYGAMLRFEWSYARGFRELKIAEWYPTNGDKIIFGFDGTPGVLVNGAFYDGAVTATDRGLAHFLSPAEQECFLWHEFEPEDADFYEPELAGSVHGLGFRGRLYWWWWLKNNLMDILMDFYDRVGTGTLMAFYEQSNAQSLAEVKAAITQQAGRNVYLFPRNRDGQSAYGGAGLQWLATPAEGAAAMNAMMQDLNAVIRSSILGESLTTSAEATGLGSGVAQAHEFTADQRTQYDATDLEWCLQRVVNVLYRYNRPGVAPGRFKFLVEKRNPQQYMEAANFAYDMGLDLDEDDLREVLSLPTPKPGKGVLSKVQGMQPAAVAGVPEGVPVSQSAAAGAAQPADAGGVGGQGAAQQGAVPTGATPQQMRRAATQRNRVLAAGAGRVLRGAAAGGVGGSSRNGVHR